MPINWGPAQPLGNWYRNLSGGVSNFVNALPSPPEWFERLVGYQPSGSSDPYMLHDDPDIAKANRSFREKDAAKRRLAAQRSLGRITSEGQ